MLRWTAVAFAVLAAALLAATAQASRFMRVGIYDEAQTLYGPVPKTFAMFKQLHVQEVRLNLYWGGRYGVAKRRPAHATNPADPAYDWDLYDRTVNYAAQNGVHILFSIYGTPGWANGGRGPNVAPTRATDLRNFAFAAARRYGGAYPGLDGRDLPAVRDWLAWNEPNNPLFLSRSSAGRRAAGRSRARSTTQRSVLPSTTESTRRSHPASGSGAASPRRAGTTTRTAPARPCLRSRSSVRSRRPD